MTAATMTASKTLRVLWFSNNRVTDSSQIPNAETKKQSNRNSSKKTTEPTASNDAFSTRTQLEELPVPQPELSRTSSIPDLFRESSFAGSFPKELEDMLTLKRANRVYDSDDEDESPTKRLRISADDERDEFNQDSRRANQVLDFHDRLDEDEKEGFKIPHH